MFTMPFDQQTRILFYQLVTDFLPLLDFVEIISIQLVKFVR
jgi:hypothetical protein